MWYVWERGFGHPHPLSSLPEHIATCRKRNAKGQWEGNIVRDLSNFAHIVIWEEDTLRRSWEQSRLEPVEGPKHHNLMVTL